MKLVIFATLALLGLGTLSGCTGPSDDDSADSAAAE